jgi:ArsR family metal-binding transcriptional regulator
MGNVTRAVIELSSDISFTMPLMEKVIDGCAYNHLVPVAAFRYKNLGVIVHSNDITINNAGDEATAREVLDFLKNIINTADKRTEKLRAF